MPCRHPTKGRCTINLDETNLNSQLTKVGYQTITLGMGSTEYYVTSRSGIGVSYPSSLRKRRIHMEVCHNLAVRFNAAYVLFQIASRCRG